ncbi:hypothetical protein DPMN_003737 [Dreissena polymorpha]|uniref:C2H2-type domain-containing protein n=1 Tax=Dreissena polymorpha TaxID=45954 RepID=A0A9D4MM43_DREPO|nr:hypothetical protein DPMN_003737 [Dreissena polymorpha]
MDLGLQLETIRIAKAVSFYDLSHCEDSHMPSDDRCPDEQCRKILSRKQTLIEHINSFHSTLLIVVEGQRGKYKQYESNTSVERPKSTLYASKKRPLSAHLNEETLKDADATVLPTATDRDDEEESFDSDMDIECGSEFEPEHSLYVASSNDEEESDDENYDPQMNRTNKSGPPLNMILWGIWQGSGKPNMVSFLKPLVQNLNCLYHEGFEFVNEGQSVASGAGHCRSYQYQEHLEMRTEESIREHAKEARNSRKRVMGFYGETVFMYLTYFSLMNNVVIDYMHGALLGVVKKFMEIWFDAKFAKKAWDFHGIPCYTMDFQPKFHDNPGQCTPGGAIKLVWRCAVSPTGDRLYITSWGQRELHTLARDGTLLATLYTDPALDGPYGLHVTPAGQVLVCGRLSNTVLQVGWEGESKLANLATQEDGVWCPQSVCYSSTTSSIIVGQYGDNILVFRWLLSQDKDAEDVVDKDDLNTQKESPGFDIELVRQRHQPGLQKPQVKHDHSPDP